QGGQGGTDHRLVVGDQHADHARSPLDAPAGTRTITANFPASRRTSVVPPDSATRRSMPSSPAPSSAAETSDVTSLAISYRQEPSSRRSDSRAQSPPPCLRTFVVVS